MNDEQMEKLFRAARAAKPDTSRVEFGFEARLMGRIQDTALRQTPWYGFAWRLTPVFAAVVLALGVWNLTTTELEPTNLHATLTGESDDIFTIGYLTGD